MKNKPPIKLKHDCKNLIIDGLLAFVIIFTIGACIKFLSLFAMDSDTYFIITTGKYIVQNGNVPTINPFVIHDGFGIIVQQWLFDVLIYGIYDLFGAYGIYIYSIFAMLITLIIITKFIGLYSDSLEVKVFCAALYCFSAQIFMIARPTTISFVMCLLLIMTIERFRRKNKPQILAWAIPISLITVNIHASLWPMLFVLVLPYIAPNKLLNTIKSMLTPSIKSDHGTKLSAARLKQEMAEWFKNKKWLLIMCVAMFLVGFINPNGIKGMGYSILSYGSATMGGIIEELKAPTFLSDSGIIIIATVILLALYIIKEKDKVDAPLIYMSLGTLLLFGMHERNRWFVFFAALPLLAITLNDILSKAQMIKPEKQSLSKLAYVFISLTVVVCALVYQPASIEDSQLSPIEAVEYLDTKDKDSIVLYTGFNSGAYMEFNGYQVYLDARPELFQKKINGKQDVYTEYLEVRFGIADIQEFIEKYDFTHMIVENRTVLSGYLQACDEYKVVVKTEGYKLYESVTYTDSN